MIQFLKRKKKVLIPLGLILGLCLISVYLVSYKLPFFKAFQVTAVDPLLVAAFEKESTDSEKLDVLFLARTALQRSIIASEIERKLSTENKKVRVFVVGGSNLDMHSALQVLTIFLENRKVSNVILSDDFFFTSPQLLSALTMNKRDRNSAISRMSWKEELELYRSYLFKPGYVLKELLIPSSSQYADDDNRIIESHLLNRGSVVASDPPTALGSAGAAFARKGFTGAPLSLDEVLKRRQDENTFAQEFNSNFARYFFKRIVLLSRQKRTRLYVLRDIFQDRAPGSSFILMGEEGPEAEWNYRFKGTLSIPMERLFAGMGKEEVSGYFYTDTFLNGAGSRLYTEAITSIIDEVIKRP